ncbi:MAG: DUF4382 domain-containing protein [Chloroflexota bacterium]
MSRNLKHLIALVVILTLVLATACVPPGTAPSPGGTGPSPAPETGTIEIRVTDPPPAQVEKAIVYLTNVEVHQVSDNTSQWLTIADTPLSFDLMDVVGISQALASANVTAGKYTQIRLEVTKVVVTLASDNTSEITAEVPSGKLKIVRPFEVTDGGTTTLTLDFDGSRSLVLTGQGKAIFKPVVKLLVNQPGNQAQNQEQERENQPAPGNGQSPNQNQNKNQNQNREKEKTPPGKLDLQLQGETGPGQAVTLLVTANGEPVAGAGVTVNDQDIGLTDTNGTIGFTIPEGAEELAIKATLGDQAGELEIDLAESDQS